MNARRFPLLALAVLGSLLLGCTGMLSGLVNGPQAKNNKPTATESAVATPTAVAAATAAGSATPGMFSGLTRELDSAGKTIGGSAETIKKDTLGPAEEAIDQITAIDERAVGQAASFSVISEYGGLLFDRELVEYVNNVANVVGLQGKREPSKRTGKPRTTARRFFVGVLNDKSFNAFSLPGGYIYITRGLLENLTCESDLAWVLGHEIAHVDLEHGLIALKASVGGKAVGRKFIFGTPNNAEEATLKDEKFFSFLSERLVSFLLDHGFKSSDEVEADALGFKYSSAAGYDTQAPARVLALLAAGPADAVPGAKKRTHKDPTQRLAILEPELLHGKGSKMLTERYELAIRRIDVAVVLKPQGTEGPK